MRPKRISSGFYEYPNGVQIEFRGGDERYGYERGWYVLWPSPSGTMQQLDFEFRTLQEAILDTNKNMEAIMGPNLKESAKTYNQHELAIGTKEESEHKDTVGDNPKLWKEIAKDHLDEMPDYYTRLKKMKREVARQKAMRARKQHKEKRTRS